MGDDTPNRNPANRAQLKSSLSILRCEVLSFVAKVGYILGNRGEITFGDLHSVRVSGM